VLKKINTGVNFF